MLLVGMKISRIPHLSTYICSSAVWLAEFVLENPAFATQLHRPRRQPKTRIATERIPVAISKAKRRTIDPAREFVRDQGCEIPLATWCYMAAIIYSHYLQNMMIRAEGELQIPNELLIRLI